MSSGVFNSVTEYATRLITLLATYGDPIDADRIYLFDFISVDPTVYGLQMTPIHGHSIYSSAGISVHRLRSMETIKYLLFKGLIEISNQDGNGLLFSLSSEGIKLSESLTSKYLDCYKNNLRYVVSKIRSIPVSEILKHIGQDSVDGGKDDGTN